MKISKYYPEGDEKELEKQIKNLVARYFPKISVESEIITNRLIESKKLKKTALNASISFSILIEQKENKPAKKIDEVSFNIEEPDKMEDQTMTSEIFIG